MREISGGPLSLLALARQTPRRPCSSAAMCEIRGDAELAQRFRELAHAAAPGSRRRSSRTRRSATCRRTSIGRFARAAFGWTRNAASDPRCATSPSTWRTSASDLVPRNEAEQFLRGVDALREDVDRLEARLDLLIAHDAARAPVKLRVLARLLADPARADPARAGRLRPRHSSVSAAALRCLFSRPSIWFERRAASSRGERLRLALEELGPIFVKFGQAVSTRRDLLPPDIADELAKLQDRVPPFPGAVARAIIETRLRHSPCREVFAEFDETPLAAASIAQVHAAQLPDGKEVVVKVLRPGMRK